MSNSVLRVLTKREMGRQTHWTNSFNLPADMGGKNAIKTYSTQISIIHVCHLRQYGQFWMIFNCLGEYLWLGFYGSYTMIMGITGPLNNCSWPIYTVTYRLYCREPIIQDANMSDQAGNFRVSTQPHKKSLWGLYRLHPGAVLQPSVSVKGVSLGLLKLHCAPLQRYRAMLCTIVLRCEPPTYVMVHFVWMFLCSKGPITAC